MHDINTIQRRTPVSLKKLHKRLRRNVGRAIEDYHMINQGDRVMVGVVVVDITDAKLVEREARRQTR